MSNSSWKCLRMAATPPDPEGIMTVHITVESLVEKTAFIVSVTGNAKEPGARFEEALRAAAHALDYALVQQTQTTQPGENG